MSAIFFFAESTFAMSVHFSCSCACNNRRVSAMLLRRLSLTVFNATFSGILQANDRMRRQTGSDFIWDNRSPARNVISFSRASRAASDSANCVVTVLRTSSCCAISYFICVHVSAMFSPTLKCPHISRNFRCCSLLVFSPSRMRSVSIIVDFPALVSP